MVPWFLALETDLLKGSQLETLFAKRARMMATQGEEWCPTYDGRPRWMRTCSFVQEKDRMKLDVCEELPYEIVSWNRGIKFP